MRASLLQGAQGAGEDAFDDLLAAQQQQVDVMLLGQALARPGLVEEIALLDHRDPLETSGQDRGRQAARHAAADDHGMATAHGGIRLGSSH
ncbi:hypothetical protein [Pseudomonas chlororaphis]|uniref:hypothetical protein n=1 Tax=Pseudomonas chlororaphis TaxID=587753 RepID=UPI00215B57ED|nr:hypothetical protein [Pseudomonas chlororaphis]